jgi:hypothetical protein
MAQQTPVRPERIVSPTQLVVAVVFGVIALTIVAAKLTIPLSVGIVSDPREFFTTIGSGLTGPVGGLVIGVLAGILEPNGIPAASILAHVVGALWMGFAYKLWVYKRYANSPLRLVFWALLVVIYYVVFVIPGFVIGVRLFYPEIYAESFGNISLLDGYFATMSGVMPEMVLTTVVTTIVMLALPRQYTKPLW